MDTQLFINSVLRICPSFWCGCLAWLFNKGVSEERIREEHIMEREQLLLGDNEDMEKRGEEQLFTACT